MHSAVEEKNPDNSVTHYRANLRVDGGSRTNPSQFPSARRAVAVDFDGTIVDHEFPAIGAIKPGAREQLQRLRDLGYYVIVYSCRTCRHLTEIFNPEGPWGAESVGHQAMTQWLKENGVPFDEIDDGTRGKPYADFYIDDKGIRFENNWPEVVEFIEAALEREAVAL